MTGPFCSFTTFRLGESGGVGAAPADLVVRSSAGTAQPVMTAVAPMRVLRIKNARRSTPSGMLWAANCSVEPSGSSPISAGFERWSGICRLLFCALIRGPGNAKNLITHLSWPRHDELWPRLELNYLR